MNINTITAEDLRRMPDKEGLILQGCGGDLTEWVDGINEMLTKAGILKDGCQFENVAAFQHGELTCLLYPFDDVKLDIGKLALWRLQTHEVYGGTWLSDFVPNYLGGFIETPEALADKPDCPLIGADGNIFNLLGIASRTLREHGLKEQAKDMVLAHIFSAIIPAECAFPAFRRNLVLNCDDFHFATSGGFSSGAQNFTAP